MKFGRGSPRKVVLKWSYNISAMTVVPFTMLHKESSTYQWIILKFVGELVVLFCLVTWNYGRKATDHINQEGFLISDCLVLTEMTFKNLFINLKQRGSSGFKDSFRMQPTEALTAQNCLSFPSKRSRVSPSKSIANTLSPLYSAQLSVSYYKHIK